MVSVVGVAEMMVIGVGKRKEGGEKEDKKWRRYSRGEFRIER